jgi:hypothetical protein
MINNLPFTKASMGFLAFSSKETKQELLNKEI